MLTGIIEPISRTRTVDRSDTVFTLWEQSSNPADAELPWPQASSFGADAVRDLVAAATSVVVASASAELIELAAAALRSGVRAYAYGPEAIETNHNLTQVLAGAADRMLARLGHEPPADWIVVDEGRAGVLFVGAPDEPRRWAIPLEPALARSLFEAFRVLFWFHARREGLPEGAQGFSFRPPLPSPYPDPGHDVVLQAGRFVIDAPLPDGVPDAEFRIAPDGSIPGRAATVIMRPDARRMDVASQAAVSGAKVVWTDTGLPRTTISRQRLVMDLVAAPIGIQLEWGTGPAVGAYHRVQKACERPAWSFHARRRLDAIQGAVLLEGASALAQVQAEERITLPDVSSALASFESAEPTVLRPSGPLAKRVVYSWRTVPFVVPVGAKKAQVVAQWTALDEWAAGSVRSLRQRLDTMEGEEQTALARLRSWWRGHDQVQRERARIRDVLVEIGEQRMSQRTVTEAEDTARRLVEEGGRVLGMLQQAHAGRQKAEDDAEEAAQGEAWKARVGAAQAELHKRHVELKELERMEPEAGAEVARAEGILAQATVSVRAARLSELEVTREKASAALLAAREALASQDGVGQTSKDDRRLLTREIERLEAVAAAARRDVDGFARWTPNAVDLAVEAGTVKMAKEAQALLRKQHGALQAALPALERAAAEAFSVRVGVRLPPFAPAEIGAAPPFPTEAMPEVGELFEHQGQRFLAVRTWQLASSAVRVATRLRAEVVAHQDSIK